MTLFQLLVTLWCLITLAIILHLHLLRVRSYANYNSRKGQAPKESS